jgi:hypothetical protein
MLLEQLLVQIHPRIRSLTRNEVVECLCTVVELVIAHGLTLLRPREVDNRHDEEAVGSVGNTGKSVVPGQKRSEDAESTASASETHVRSAILENEVGAAQHQECHIQGEK